VRPLGTGRASTVFDVGDGRVLRRGGAPAREAAIMEHARRAGYPVPLVHEVREDALVLELIEGPTMMLDVTRRPWRLRSHARLLADLHKRLHAIPYEDASLLHLDLHPLNVLLGPAGPVVIDWTNARAGEPALDVALTWVIGVTSGGPAARAFLRPFLAEFDPGELRRALPDAVAYRVADPNVSDRERAKAEALLQRNG
jgi:aminoglycoside phosphotransferase (APT) family kinase protein